MVLTNEKELAESCPFTSSASTGVVLTVAAWLIAAILAVVSSPVLLPLIDEVPVTANVGVDDPDIVTPFTVVGVAHFTPSV